MRKFSFHSRTIPFAFLLLCLIAYGLLIPQLGFYWDDWPYTWFAHTLGPLGLIKALANDRPFLAGIYMTTTTLLGPHPLAWQMFAIITRWLSVLALWWTLRQTWPRAQRQAAFVGLLFAVYPGFPQHWVSVIYSQAYLLMASTLLSLGLMVYTSRTPRRKLYWPLTLVAMLLSAFSLFSTEYFAGVELARPLLLWFALQEDHPNARQRFLPALLAWLPYLAELIFFGVWRAFLFQAETYHVEAFKSLEGGILATVVDLLYAMVTYSFNAGLSVWGKIFNTPNMFEFDTRGTQLYWLVAVVSLVLLMAYLLKVRFREIPAEVEIEPDNSSRWSLQAILTGALVLFASMIPFWVAALPLNISFPYDRFTLAMMFGSSLLVVGLLEFFIRTRTQKIVLLSILVAMSAALQFQTANTFRREYDNMRSFFYQLSWRAPGIKPETMLISYELPFVYYSDNSLSAPLNWIYAPDNHSEDMPYVLLYLRARANSVLPALKENEPARVNFRALIFKGNTNQSLVFQYTGSSCLRILDPIYNNEKALTGLHSTLIKAIPLSNLDQIVADSANPVQLSTELFGPANTNTWCYYYQKAELARQTGDWNRVIQLYNEAVQKRLRTKNPSEGLVFAEAYAHTGDWQRSKKESVSIVRQKPELKTAVCQIWDRLKVTANPGPAEQKLIQDAQTELKCTQK